MLFQPPPRDTANHNLPVPIFIPWGAPFPFKTANFPQLVGGSDWGGHRHRIGGNRHDH